MAIEPDRWCKRSVIDQLNIRFFGSSTVKLISLATELTCSKDSPRSRVYEYSLIDLLLN